MANSVLPPSENHDSNAESRKSDHINLAFSSIIDSELRDTRFEYEPLLNGHPKSNDMLHLKFLGKNMRAPIWVSSMTGGTGHARTINHNLARMCGEYKLGMGLGSCRQLLYDDTFLGDFAVRKYMGDQPLFANLGIAQCEQLVAEKKYDIIKSLISKLEADGLIIHINPLQEWLQPEGDRYFRAPLDTIAELCDHLPNTKIIIKEVGQGMGPRSIAALLQLPIEAIDFAAIGGTNFASLELMRSNDLYSDTFQMIPKIGHTAAEMVDYVNHSIVELGDKLRCRQIIISGGVKDFVDGYYLTSKCKLPSIYGHASPFLKHATEDYEKLQQYIELQLNGLSLVHNMLKAI